MTATNLSRRQFARTVGTALGAAIIAEHLTPAAEARLPKGTPDSVIQLNSNENPYGPAKSALEAMTRSQRVASRYPDAMEDKLVQTIAKLHSVEPENIILGCGSGEILRTADMAFTGPGKNVVAAEPTFEAVLAFAQVTRAEGIKVPLTADFRHNLPAMAAACNANTGMVYVCNPNNPTGTIVTRDELAAFLPKVPASTIIMVDEAYHHFVEDAKYGSTFEWLSKTPNLLVVRTFSKVYGMAGMRLGYGVSAKQNVAAMRRHLTWSNANAAVLEAAVASMNDAAHVPQQRKLNNDTRRWMCSELEKDGRHYIPSQANFVMIDVGGDVKPVIDAFRKKDILVGRKFPSMGNWLRISVGTCKETEAFVAGLREIVPMKKAQAA